MLATFADAKGQHPANPELRYVHVLDDTYLASDGYRWLWIRAEESIEKAKMVPTDFFAKLKGKENVPQLLAQWLDSTSYSVSDGCDVSRLPDLYVMEAPVTSMFRAHRMRFMDRLELVMTTNKESGVELDVLEGAIRLVCSKDDITTRSELWFEAGQNGFHPFSTRVNGTYLFQALDTFTDDMITIKFIDQPDFYMFLIHGESQDMVAAVALAKDGADNPFEEDE
jgi:exonuclease III